MDRVTIPPMDWVEQRARAIMETVPNYVWDGQSLPVPVEDIVDSCFGLQVLDVSDMTTAPECPQLGADESLSGLLRPGTKEIWCNANEGVQWPSRRRFTIAHELGHWVMHRPGQHSLFCRKAVVAPEDTDFDKARAERSPLPEIEQEANAFAAELLMPARLIEHHYRNTTREFEGLCAMFGSSGAAMSRRLRAVI